MIAALTFAAVLFVPPPAAVPPTGPAPTATEDVPLGPFEYSHATKLTWPGAYTPTFALVPERRVVHTFSLRLRHENLRWLSAELAVVEPTRNPEKFLQGSNALTLEGRSYAWLGGQAKLPNGARIKFGRSFVAVASALIPKVPTKTPRLSIVFPEGFFTRRWR